MNWLNDIAILITAATLILCQGCSRPFFRSTQGTNTSIALSIPDEEYIKLNIVSYLNGEVVMVRDPSNITYKFKAAETNNYFGVVKTESYRESEITTSITNNYNNAVK